MCPVAKIASCEIAFIPISSADYIGDIKKVLQIIDSSELEYTVGIFSTTIRGEKEKVLNLIREIYEAMDDTCGFTMDIRISNVCGCSK